MKLLSKILLLSTLSVCLNSYADNELYKKNFTYSYTISNNSTHSKIFNKNIEVGADSKSLNVKLSKSENCDLGDMTEIQITVKPVGPTGIFDDTKSMKNAMLLIVNENNFKDEKSNVKIFNSDYDLCEVLKESKENAVWVNNIVLKEGEDKSLVLPDNNKINIKLDEVKEKNN